MYLGDRGVCRVPDVVFVRQCPCGVSLYHSHPPGVWPSQGGQGPCALPCRSICLCQSVWHMCRCGAYESPPHPPGTVHPGLCPCDHRCVSHHMSSSPWPLSASHHSVKCPVWRQASGREHAGLPIASHEVGQPWWPRCGPCPCPWPVMDRSPLCGEVRVCVWAAHRPPSVCPVCIDLGFCL